jgi:hypothetical protein
LNRQKRVCARTGKGNAALPIISLTAMSSGFV